MGFGSDCGIVLRHSLAHAGDLWRRCLINKQSPAAVARALNFSQRQVAGCVRMLRSVGYVPSQERCALMVMNDWGMDDEDIAEIFGQTKGWSAKVRRNAAKLRAAEPVPRHLEFVDEGLRPHDPSPEELYRRAAEIRAARETQRDLLRSYAPTQGGMRHFAWNARHASFVSVISGRWTKG